MKRFLFCLALLFSEFLIAESLGVDKECLQYGQNYVVKGSFLSSDPGGKTYNLSRLVNDFNNELNHFDKTPNEEKINCLRQIFDRAKRDASEYWANRISKDQCREGDDIPNIKPEACPDQTWNEMRKSIADIKRNESLYQRAIESCSQNEKSGRCESPELLKQAQSASDNLTAANTAACCDKNNGAAYQVLKTFYTVEFSGNESTLSRECLKRTKPETNSLWYNVPAGIVECSRSLVLGLFESFKQLGSMLSGLDLGIVTELYRLISSKQGREELVQKLGSVLAAIGNQITAQFESTFSCFNPYYRVQNACKLTGSMVTEFLIGGGISKLLKSVILPVLKGTLKPAEMAAKMIKDSKVAKDFATKMKPINDSFTVTKANVSYSVHKVSQAALAKARAIAISAKLRTSPPIDRMLSSVLKEKYPIKMEAKISSTPTRPPTLNREFKVTSNTTTYNITQNLGTSTARVLTTKITTKEAQSLFQHFKKQFKGKTTLSTKQLKALLERDLPKSSLPKKYGTSSSLSVEEKLAALRETFTTVAKIGSRTDKIQARNLLKQLDEFVPENRSLKPVPKTPTSSIKSTPSTNDRLDITNKRDTLPSSSGSTPPVAEFPKVDLTEVIPDVNNLSPAMKTPWAEISDRIKSFQNIDLSSPGAPQLMRQAWNNTARGASQKASEMHNHIDTLLRNKAISPDHAASLHRIVAVSEQTAFNAATRPQFLGTTIVAPNANPGTFTKIIEGGKKAAGKGASVVMNNKVGAATYSGHSAANSFQQANGFDEDTIKNSEIEVEKLESELDSDQKAQKYFEKLKTRDEVEEELDRIRARIAVLKGSGTKISADRRKELDTLLDRVERMAQLRSNELIPIPTTAKDPEAGP